jgi:tripartite-type tricarboxylate transporter receptor subunit TctC
VYALPYDLQKDLAPIALITTNPQVIIGRKGIPANDLKGLIAWLRANPDKALQGTAGTGSPSHVAGTYFQNSTGTRFQFVPYRGGAPAMQALLNGQIDIGFEQAANAIPHIREGTIKAYAVTDRKRLATAPGVPTADEAGLPGFYISVWHGLWAPRGAPKQVITTLNAAVMNALADAKVHQRLSEVGQEIPPRNQQTPDALAAIKRRK